MPITQRPFSVNCYLLPKAWFRCHILPLRRGDIDDMKKTTNKFIYADQLEKPKDLIKYRPRSAGGLQLHNIDCKSTTMLIKTFLELAVSPKHKNSLLFNALFKHHILDNTNTNIPNCLAFYNISLFQNIKSAMKDHCMESWSSKQWYSHLLDQNVLCEEVIENGSTSWVPKKCNAEVTFPEYDWDTIWARARMPGLSNEVRSFYWKFFHNLLPTQSRLHRITRTTATPLCIQCDTGEVDHAWYHTFTTCPVLKPTIDWILEKLNRLQIYFDSVEGALWLQFPLAASDAETLPAVWLVGESLAYAWARRRNREAIDVRALNASLMTNANYLRNSARHANCGENLDSVLSS